jgi:hypothetical protein
LTVRFFASESIESLVPNASRRSQSSCRMKPQPQAGGAGLSLQGSRIFDRELANRHAEPALVAQLALCALLPLPAPAGRASRGRSPSDDVRSADPRENDGHAPDSTKRAAGEGACEAVWDLPRAVGRVLAAVETAERVQVCSHVAVLSCW